MTTVEYWPEQRLLFVAAPYSGIVDVLRVPEGPRETSLHYVGRLAENHRSAVVRLAMDRVNGRLWVADRKTVYAYAFKPQFESRQVRIPVDADDPITELIVDADGNALVFSGRGIIYRVPAASLQPEKWLDAAGGASREGAREPIFLGSRALLTKDGSQVLFQFPKDNRLVRVELQSRKLIVLERSTPIHLLCGPFFWMDQREGSLATFHCQEPWVGVIKFDPELRKTSERYVPARPE